LPAREHPDVPGSVTGDSHDMVVGQAVLGRIGGKDTPIVSRDAASLGAGPDRAIRRLVQTDEPVVPDARRIAAIENSESDAIEANQPIEGGHPDVTVAGLLNGFDDVVRQAVVGRPGLHLVLRRGDACGEHHGKQEGAYSDGTDGHDRHAERLFASAGLSTLARRVPAFNGKRSGGHGRQDMRALSRSAGNCGQDATALLASAAPLAT
jgi:hypothetical protein